MAIHLAKYIFNYINLYNYQSPTTLALRAGPLTRHVVATSPTLGRGSFYTITLSLIIALICFDATAKTNLPIPRFASSRSSEINVRVGPGPNYPVVWRIIKPGIPLEITAEFDTWRRIRDWDGMSGWVHQSMLSGNRYAIVSNKNGVILHKSNNLESKRIAKLLYNARLSIKKCKENWCLLRHNDIEGWAKSQDLWGVYKDEKVG